MYDVIKLWGLQSRGFTRIERKIERNQNLNYYFIKKMNFFLYKGFNIKS